MDNATLSGILDKWMPTGAYQLKMNIPSGSGVCRLVDVSPDIYQTGFVSTEVGSFKEALVSGNWAGTDWTTCFSERPPSRTPIYEVTRFNADTPALNGFSLPPEVLQAIYDDKDLPGPEKFEKSHIVSSYAGRFLPEGSYSGIYFPSRRNNEGGVFMYNPRAVASAQIIYTGVLPPPSGVMDW